MIIIIIYRMQVEVSKHTEGTKEKTLRPNGLPESLIRYDGTRFFLLIFHKPMSPVLILFDVINLVARQKEMASSSVTELVEAVKRPRSLSESTNRHPFMTESGKKEKQDKADASGLGRRKSAETTYTPPPPPPRRNSHAGVRTIKTMQPIDELPEKKQKKPRRLSFMGYSNFLTFHVKLIEFHKKNTCMHVKHWRTLN